MNLQLTEEQALLRDSVERWVAVQMAAPGAPASPPATDSAAPASRCGVARSPIRARWAAMADFGWLAMTLPAAHEGLGLGLAEACVLAESLGAGPLALPYLPAILHAGELLAAGGDAAQRGRWLPGMASGALLVVPALTERQGLGGEAQVQATAQRCPGGWQLDGHKSVVPFGDLADAWLVSARDEAGQLRFLVVPRGTAGVRVTPFETVDGAGACALVFVAAILPEDACLRAATPAVAERALDRARVRGAGADAAG